MLFFVINLFLLTPLTIIQGTSTPSAPSSLDKETISYHSFIDIQNNTALESISIVGNGSESNPFIISNYVIKCNFSYTVGLSIQNTTAYFIIDNVVITSCPTGINFINVQHGSIVNSSIEFSSIGFIVDTSMWFFVNNLSIQHCNQKGLYFWHDLNFSIQNSFVKNSSSGFDLNYVYQADIVNNTALNNQYHGFYFSESAHDTLAFNVAGSNDVGFKLFDCLSIDITYSFALNNSYSGFYLEDSAGILLLNNSAESCGLYSIFLIFSNNNNLSNNIVSNGTGDAFLISVSDSNTLIVNEAFNNIDYGFHLENSNNNILINNPPKNNKKGDLSLTNSKHTVLKNNSFTKHDNSNFLLDLVLILLIISLLTGILLKREFKR